MKPALLDSDTISYFFKGNPKVVNKVDEYLKEHGFLYFSVITYYEILNGLLYKDARKQLARFQEFSQLNQILPISVSVAASAAETYAYLRTRNQLIGHNDVLIAATAKVNELVLVTNNTEHFYRIPDLKLENWAD